MGQDRTIEGYVYSNGKLYQKSHRDAKVGDLILIVERDHDCEPYKNGDIFTVGKFYGGSVDTEGDGYFILDDEFVVLEPVTQIVVDGQQYNVVKRKANVGETVLVVDNTSVDKHKLPLFSVDIISRLSTFSGRLGTEKSSSFMTQDDYLVLEPVTAKKTAKDYANIGDYIKITGNSNSHRFAIGEIVKVKKLHTGNDVNENGVSTLIAEHLDGSDWWNVQVDEFEVVTRESVIEQFKQKVSDVQDSLTALQRLATSVSKLV